MKLVYMIGAILMQIHNHPNAIPPNSSMTWCRHVQAKRARGGNRGSGEKQGGAIVFSFLLWKFSFTSNSKFIGKPLKFPTIIHAWANHIYAQMAFERQCVQEGRTWVGLVNSDQRTRLLAWIFHFGHISFVGLEGIKNSSVQYFPIRNTKMASMVEPWRPDANWKHKPSPDKSGATWLHQKNHMRIISLHGLNQMLEC